ncbi:SDR family oxidoreductase [Streptomyces luteireticuli]|uniref:SDR family oxidoreductase n=1 Tax=Streptomyces luteireticuli TaxID=173858 RepID=UPI003558D9E4
MTANDFPTGTPISTLTGRRVVVLGGTSGVGLATAALSAQHGADVVVVSRNPRSVERAQASLPPTATAETADLTDAAQVSALMERLGSFDHLVFTAGEPLELTPLDTLDVKAAREFFGLRYFGALSAVTAAIPHLRPGGSVVLTSGTAGQRSGPGWAVAASICGAVESLTRAMAVELAPVRVNAVRLGMVRTPLWSHMQEDEREEMYAHIGRSLPTGRVGGAEEAAEAYLFLMNQRFATGSVVTVDGGGLLV